MSIVFLGHTFAYVSDFNIFMLRLALQNFSSSCFAELGKSREVLESLIQIEKSSRDGVRGRREGL